MRSLALSLCLLSLSAFAQLWTDPAKAAAEDPDFLIQGEYVSEAGDIGAQVVALSKGKFDVYVLTGGLPGAGWDRSKARVKVPAETKDGATTGTGTNISVTITDGGLTVKRGKGSSALKRVERDSDTLGAKAPTGAKVLFDGSSADQWKGGKLDGDPNDAAALAGAAASGWHQASQRIARTLARIAATTIQNPNHPSGVSSVSPSALEVITNSTNSRFGILSALVNIFVATCSSRGRSAD